MNNDQGLSSLRWVIVCLAIIVSTVAVMIDKNNQITTLKAQLASAQPTAVSGAIFIEPTDQPFDRVTWTDPVDYTIHLLACGEPVVDNQTGEMRLVSQYRVGKTIAKVSLVIP